MASFSPSPGLLAPAPPARLRVQSFSPLPELRLLLPLAPSSSLKQALQPAFVKLGKQADELKVELDGWELLVDAPWSSLIDPTTDVVQLRISCDVVERPAKRRKLESPPSAQRPVTPSPAGAAPLSSSDESSSSDEDSDDSSAVSEYPSRPPPPGQQTAATAPGDLPLPSSSDEDSSDLSSDSDSSDEEDTAALQLKAIQSPPKANGAGKSANGVTGGGRKAILAGASSSSISSDSSDSDSSSSDSDSDAEDIATSHTEKQATGSSVKPGAGLLRTKKRNLRRRTLEASLKAKATLASMDVDEGDEPDAPVAVQPRPAQAAPRVDKGKEKEELEAQKGGKEKLEAKQKGGKEKAALSTINGAATKDPYAGYSGRGKVNGAQQRSKAVPAMVSHLRSPRLSPVSMLDTPTTEEDPQWRPSSPSTVLPPLAIASPKPAAKIEVVAPSSLPATAVPSNIVITRVDVSSDAWSAADAVPGRGEFVLRGLQPLPVAVKLEWTLPRVVESWDKLRVAKAVKDLEEGGKVAVRVLELDTFTFTPVVNTKFGTLALLPAAPGQAFRIELDPSCLPDPEDYQEEDDDEAEAAASLGIWEGIFGTDEIRLLK